MASSWKTIHKRLGVVGTKCNSFGHFLNTSDFWKEVNCLKCILKRPCWRPDGTPWP